MEIRCSALPEDAWCGAVETENLQTNIEKAGTEFNKQISSGSVSTASFLSELQSAGIAEFQSQECMSRQCSEIDAKALQVVLEKDVQEAVGTVVTDCQFCVTVADPRDPNVPLIAVSDQFEAMTGYSRSEVLGKNCRFLRLGCPDTDPLDVCKLRVTCRTGAPFTSVLTNRRKTGELFLNLLDLRRLTVAQNPYTGEELWFLVGIQADVTHLTEESWVACLPELKEVTERIRAKLVDDLKTFAVVGALAANSQVQTEAASNPQHARDAWCILPEPAWQHDGDIAPVLPLFFASHMENFLRSRMHRWEGQFPESWHPKAA
jgi:hypothetical protein